MNGIIKTVVRSIYSNWDSIMSFLFIGAIFYMFYFSLWIFCPC